jgi:hypothetical protein
MSRFALNVMRRNLHASMIRYSQRFREWDGGGAIQRVYEGIHGKPLNRDNPTTYTELLFCHMLDLNRHGNPLFTRLADKLLAREFVAARIGPDYLVPALWHGDDPERIPFDALRAPYIIKTTHGSGGHIVIDGAFDRAAVIKRLRKSLRQNYYWAGREYQYFDIVPRIIVETLLDDGHDHGPWVYRLFCFGGQVEVVQVSDSVLSLHAFFDRAWNKLDITYRTNYRAVDIPKPALLERLVELSSCLAENIDFVRVDFYIVEGRIYFSEMTFTPEAGRLKFVDDKWDEWLGALWLRAKADGVRGRGPAEDELRLEFS